MKLSKTDQLKRTVPTKKVCTTCQKNRDLKFFSSKQARICGECKRRKWRTDLKNSPGKLNKNRDDQWSLDIKTRDGFKCCYCDKTTYLNSHHIFSRSNHSVRWDMDNGICLCSGHHTLNSDFSAHKTPAEFIEWIKERNGIEWYERLRAKARQVDKS